MANSASSPSFRDRLVYQSIRSRPKLTLPDNARVAVYTIVNVENWHPENAQPRTVLPPPMGQPLLPDLPNWAWHEYGMRVGIWRFFDAIEKRGLKATFALNGTVCELYPEIVREAHRLGWDFMGHGYIQKPMHKVEDQLAAIKDTMAAIKNVTGKPPRGWESPGLTENHDTADLLAEAGIEYVADWVLDDQPVPIKTKTGRLISVPYTVEINDVVMSAVQLKPSDEIFNRGKDHFDRLYQEGVEHPRIMAISVHPYLTGVPHRIKYLEMLYDYILSHQSVVHMTGANILDWYLDQTKTQSAR